MHSLEADVCMCDLILLLICIKNSFQTPTVCFPYYHDKSLSDNWLLPKWTLQYWWDTKPNLDISRHILRVLQEDSIYIVNMHNCPFTLWKNPVTSILKLFHFFSYLLQVKSSLLRVLAARVRCKCIYAAVWKTKRGIVIFKCYLKPCISMTFMIYNTIASPSWIWTHNIAQSYQKSRKFALQLIGDNISR